MRMDPLYQTSDLYIAAYLLSKGLQLQDIDHSNKRSNFISVDRQDRPELVHSFVCARAVGNLADFLYHLKKARRLLYSRDV